MGVNGDYKLPDKVVNDGCELGRHNLSFIRDIGKDIRGINQKFWAMVIVVFIQLVSIVSYFITHR